jgi:hypothetical protein
MSMKILKAAAVAAVALCVSAPVLAQEHFTEGPVWECSMYRVKEGKWDAYMKFIRSNANLQYAEAKKQGLLVDYRSFTKPLRNKDDWNYMICMQWKNMAAYDYDQSFENKWDAITAARMKTTDTEKQMEMTKQRFEMRDFVGNIIMREVNLRAP